MQSIQIGNRALVVADVAMESTLKLADRAARSGVCVLICGESGTGKELVARYIHAKSPRAHGPFVSINCAALPEGLMEAELFGYEKGAFTGALTQRIGKFELASGGTLLLDEVSEMAIHLQAKLLRVIQEREVDRLGGRRAIPIDSRIIATTNRDPIELVETSRFREDLYFRLNVVQIHCRPLRGRGHAIRLLAEQFVRAACLDQEKEVELSSDSFRFLEAYHWPGNIRELQNVIEKAILMTDSSVVEPHDIELSKWKVSAPSSRSLDAVERQHIFQVLEKEGGNRTRAAGQLGISARTLRNKLKEYGSGE